eukprot:TRINITY_DN83667_c0_g1_i1.p1 TRINITY_DN83667_c0_g1~~TRINITY_DN83667_c0_g1_i1.p1  ORF type:complete len:348 (-),score=64.44 TRINITY_DN83667_c0_g1_i1:113-1156(-)
MPEGPEIYGMAAVINRHAAGRAFLKISISNVTKQSKVPAPAQRFNIKAKSRGKELRLRLSKAGGDDTRSERFVLCNMGMTGFWHVASAGEDLHKHAHLRFHAEDGSILSFCDQRRFGTWRLQDTPEWGSDRGPDVVFEHAGFRQHVLSQVKEKQKRFTQLPICEALMDQSLFNGIGNYLRAEILYRAGVPPFAPTAACLAAQSATATASARKEKMDIITLCRDVPREVIDFGLDAYQGGKASGDTDTRSQHDAWEAWCKVYSKSGSRWALDKSGRRVWFKGKPGKLYDPSVHGGELGKSKSSASAVKKRVSKKPAMALTKKRPASVAVKKRPAAKAGGSISIKRAKR